MLVLSRRPGESIVIGDNIEIFVSKVNGDRVAIGIAAPRQVAIMRAELMSADTDAQAKPSLSSSPEVKPPRLSDRQ